LEINIIEGYHPLAFMKGAVRASYSPLTFKKPAAVV